MAFVFGLVVSYWVFIPALVLAIYAEYTNSHKSSAFFTIVGLTSAYFIFSVPLIVLAAYIPIGIAWSVWRWRIHCSNVLEDISKGKVAYTGGWKEHGRKYSKEELRENLLERTNLVGNVDKIISWIICFPASMVERLGHDLIHVLKVFVTEWFAKVYNHSSQRALDKFDKERDNVS